MVEIKNRLLADVGHAACSQPWGPKNTILFFVLTTNALSKNSQHETMHREISSDCQSSDSGPAFCPSVLPSGKKLHLVFLCICVKKPFSICIRPLMAINHTRNLMRLMASHLRGVLSTESKKPFCAARPASACLIPGYMCLRQTATVLQ